MILNARLCRRLRFTSRAHQGGMSLVELMIALLLSVIIVAALSELYVNISRANQEMAKTNGQIENARFAIQFLQNDIVHAGYWGSFTPEFDDLTIITAPTDVPGAALPDPCLAFTTPWTDAYINALIGISVQPYSANPGTCLGAGVVEDRLAGTDVLVVRHANTCVPGDVNCEGVIDGNLYFQVSNCEAEIDAGLFYTLDTTPASFIRYERDCDGASGSPPTFTAGTVASKRKFIQNIYYIRDWANTVGDGIPTLVRSEFDFDGVAAVQQDAVELVQGIEGFRVELGVDNISDTNEPVILGAAINWLDPDDLISPRNRGDGIPDGNFVHCGAASCTAAQLTNAVAVKLYLLARTDQATPGYTDTKTYQMGSGAAIPAFNDNFKRHVFSTTVRINNVAGRRETPL